MAADPYIPAGETLLWRYMKLNSFLELLSGHLIQTRIDVLNDAAEGAYGYKHIRLSGASDVPQAIREARQRVVATYWFEFEERESSGMWSVYGRTGESVAIFFHKRREYKEEREIRSVQVFPARLKESIVDQRLSLDDLNRLVKRIILAPDSRQTFIEAVKHVVESVFAFEHRRFAGEICGSALDQEHSLIRLSS